MSRGVQHMLTPSRNPGIIEHLRKTCSGSFKGFSYRIFVGNHKTISSDMLAPHTKSTINHHVQWRTVKLPEVPPYRGFLKWGGTPSYDPFKWDFPWKKTIQRAWGYPHDELERQNSRHVAQTPWSLGRWEQLRECGDLMLTGGFP